ncbi:MAG: ABC transporter permease, partial [Thermoplasmata archaeon]
MWLPARIATRFILASKKQSALIIIGIAVGVSIQIFIGILIQSLQASLIDRTVGSSPHIRITSENGTICSWEAMIEIAEEEEGVRVVSPVKDGYALLKNTGNNPSVLIRGMNLTEADKIYKLTRKLIAGTLAQNATVPLQNSINNTNSTSSNETETIYIEAVIGKLLAEENNLHTGDNISILTSAGATYNLTISGICNFRVSQLNRQWILIPLKAAQYIFNTGNNISSI